MVTKSEIKCLEEWLIMKGIKYSKPFNPGKEQIKIVFDDGSAFSFVCGPGTYGYERGLIEFWDFSEEHQPIGNLNVHRCKKIIRRKIGYGH